MPACSRIMRVASSARATMALASGSRSLPSGVHSTRRPYLSNSRTPSSPSKRAICLLIAGCVRCASEAARVKLRTSATATNDLSWSSSIALRIVMEKRSDAKGGRQALPCLLASARLGKLGVCAGGISGRHPRRDIGGGMRVSIGFLGILRDQMGQSGFDLDLPDGAGVADFMDAIAPLMEQKAAWAWDREEPPLRSAGGSHQEGRGGCSGQVRSRRPVRRW